ncbi:hypothetical protein LCGC14_1334900 [marine sediment metagenome]|uniref:Uncharacterized protein n=1 Tax=marine sediment metagenome TaxID=412755 RepID=A0A0F9KFE0_9ZZZZ
MDKNIFTERTPSRTLFRYAKFFMLVAAMGRKEDKERHVYLGRILFWKAKVIQRNEKRLPQRRKRSNISSPAECQILQFPSIKEIA